MKAPLPPAFGLAGRLLAGAVLIYAGATKAAGPTEEFALVIGSYQLLGKDAAMSAAAFLPWLELLLGWSLLLGFKLRLAAAGAGGLFAAFLFALLSVQLRGIELPNCGCFGDGIHLLPWQAFLLDCAFLAGCAAAWKAAPKLTLDGWADAGYTGAK